MEIDHNAPLTARDEIIINAPVEEVWAVHTDIEQWPQWQSNISSATLEGPLAKGTVFRWKAQGLNITSTLQVVEPYEQIGWTGTSLGMRAVHIWYFEPVSEGTRVITEESLSGWLARLMGFFDSKFLEKSIVSSLAVLKNQVEASS